jgi:lipase
MGRAPTARRIAARDGDIVYWEWPGDATAPLVLFLHATGFHGRVWDATIRALPADWRAIALDMPGHGQSGRRGPIQNWEEFTPPVVAAIDALGIEGAIGVGHSMGGFTVALSALNRPRAFAKLMLVDPVMHPPGLDLARRFDGMAGPEAHPVAKRRDRWPDWQAFHDRFKDRSPYALWRPDVFEEYCRHGLVPAEDGDGCVLACAPILEASVYFNSWRADILDRLIEIDAPTTVLRAKYTDRDPSLPTDYLRSTTWEGLVSYLKHGRDVYLPEFTHFIPMQAPDRVAAEIRAAAGR